MKLNYSRTFFIGLAFLSICTFWQMYDNVIPLMLQSHFHLDDTTIGVIMSLDNVLAVILLPVIGILSDRVDTKLGKRTPFIIVGTLIAVCSMSLLPIAAGMGSLVLFIVALGITLLAMAFYRSPAVALMPDLTPKPLRSKANAVINLMGAIGGMLALVFISMLVPKVENPSYSLVFSAVAIVMILAVVVLLLTTKEKDLAKELDLNQEDKSVQTSNGRLPAPVQTSLNYILLSIFLWFMAYNAVTTAFSRYATVVWKMQGGSFADCLLIATVAAIISYIPIGFFTSKIGRKKCIMIGLWLLVASYAFAAVMPVYHPIINVGFVLIGVGWAAVSVNSLPMVVEMAKGSDIGKYTGFYYTFSMAAQIFTPIVSGFLLQKISYATLFPYSVVFTLLAIYTMSKVQHGDSMPETKKDLLDNFDVED